MDSYLSGGERYPTFEQPGPVVQNLDFCLIGIPPAHDLGFDWLKTISWDLVNVFSIYALLIITMGTDGVI